MSAFADKAKVHLTSYKIRVLRVTEAGRFRDRNEDYGHILPAKFKELNIVESIRTEFWDYERRQLKLPSQRLTLHQYFHHLTSSQALAFNLFFPFLKRKPQCVGAMLKALDLSWNSCLESAFEKLLLAKENTSFDFWMRSTEGAEATVEVKFTEGEFGSAKDDERHRRKHHEIYRPLLSNLVRPAALELPAFFRSYQLLRNIAFARQANPHRRTILLLPGGDTRFVEKTRRWLDENLLPTSKPLVHLLLLEEVIATLAKGCSGDSFMEQHIKLFREKYLPTNL